jgi:hypothetical protein
VLESSQPSAAVLDHHQQGPPQSQIGVPWPTIAGFAHSATIGAACPNACGGRCFSGLLPASRRAGQLASSEIWTRYGEPSTDPAIRRRGFTRSLAQVDGPRAGSSTVFATDKSENGTNSRQRESMQPQVIEL